MKIEERAEEALWIKTSDYHVKYSDIEMVKQIAYQIRAELRDLLQTVHHVNAGGNPPALCPDGKNWLEHEIENRIGPNFSVKK